MSDVTREDEGKRNATDTEAGSESAASSRLLSDEWRRPEPPRPPSPESSSRPDQPTQISNSPAASESSFTSLQSLLSNLGKVLVAPTGGNAKDAEALSTAIKSEMKDGKFGTASQQAYSTFSSLLRHRSLGLALQLQALGLEQITGAPVKLPLKADGQRANPASYELIVHKQLAVKEPALTSKTPTESELKALADEVHWSDRASAAISQSENAYVDLTLSKSIAEGNFPAGWQKKDTDDPAVWRESAQPMMHLAMQTGGYVSVMQSLFRASKNDDFPLSLPSGTVLILNKDGETRSVNSDQLNEPNNRRILKDWTLSNIQIALPDDLSRITPDNNAKISAMRKWLSSTGAQVEKTLATMKTFDPNGEDVVMFGDEEIRNGKGLFDAQGRFKGLVNANSYKANNGESFRDVNLVGYDFNVKQTGSGADSKIIVQQTIKAEQAPVYAYKNIRALGIKTVGEPMMVSTKEFAPEDFVPVRNGAGIELVQAKHLQSFKYLQMTGYFGPKAVMGALDVATVAAAVVGLGAVVKGAQLGAVASAAALRLSSKEVALEGGKNLLKLVAGAAGLAENAGAQDTELGRALVQFRGLYFTADMANGVKHFGAKALTRHTAAGAGEGVVKAVTAEEKLQAVLEQMPRSKQMQKLSESFFGKAEGYFVGDLVLQMRELSKELKDNGRSEPLAEAQRRMSRLGRTGEFSSDPQEAHPSPLAETKEILNGFAALIEGATEGHSKERVSRIAERTSQLLRDGASGGEHKAFVKELAANLSFSPAQVVELEIEHSGRDRELVLTNQMIQTLNRLDNPSSIAPPDREFIDLNPKLRSIAERFISSRDKDVLTSSRIALLQLSQLKNGEMPERLATTELSLPSYERDGLYDQTASVDARRAEMKVDSKDVLAALNATMAESNPGARAVAAGEMLFQLGKISPIEFAATLSSVVKNQNASKAVRLNALHDEHHPRLVSLVSSLSQSGYFASIDPVENYGYTKRDFQNILRQSASGANDGDVRAMSAGLLFALTTEDRKLSSSLASAMTRKYNQLQNTPGAFPKFISEQVSTAMQQRVQGRNPDSIRMSRIQLADIAALMTPPNDKFAQDRISKTIAESASATSVNVTLRALDSLIPDRLGQLDQRNKFVADNLRRIAVESIRQPRKEETEATIALVNRMGRLFDSKETPDGLGKVLEQRLVALVKPSASTGASGTASVRLSIAAINTLAQMGSTTSIEAIRKRVTTPDENAEVRLSALNALDKLSDPLLPTVVDGWIQNESDPAVAARLIDVKARHVPLDPLAASNVYDDFARQARGPFANYPELTRFDQSKAKEWLRQTFPLLDLEAFRTATANARLNTSVDWFASAADLKTERMRAQGVVAQQRMKQWTELSKLALSTAPDAAKAKVALLNIIKDGGGTLGQEEGFIPVSPTDANVSVPNKNWPLLAARVLKESATPGMPSRDLTLYAVSQAIKDESVSAAVGDELRQCLSTLSQSSGVTKTEVLAILESGLRAELNRPIPNLSYRQNLISDISKLGMKRMEPALHAISDNSPQSARSSSADGIR